MRADYETCFRTQDKSERHVNLIAAYKVVLQ